MDADEEEYRLNRELYTDTYAYRQMEADALRHRAFEDIVVEFDESYRPDRPLKVIGGQHRVKSIQEAVGHGVSEIHGLRVFFDLNDEQKVDIATVNNTSIVVANDLLDRMQEELLGTDLRDWSQRARFLDARQNFADKRNPEGIPTVRSARTFIVNYYLGINGDALDSLHVPYICVTGPRLDQKYAGLHPQIEWKDENLLRAGKEWARLHALQQERVRNRDEDNHSEYANKALHPTVLAAWAYSAGLFQREPAHLNNHYALGEWKRGDPLNAVALYGARLKVIDPDNYRGLGARMNRRELGRMFEVFNLQASKGSGITEKLANAAIMTYEAKQRNVDAEKARRNI